MNHFTFIRVGHVATGVSDYRWDNQEGFERIVVGTKDGTSEWYLICCIFVLPSPWQMGHG